WNYQFTRELSARVILQYNSVLSNPLLSSLSPTKNFNADFLITYLVHPGTAIYVGYNSNLQNLDRRLIPTPTGLLTTRNDFMNDSRQFFVKVSYLLRFWGTCMNLYGFFEPLASLDCRAAGPCHPEGARSLRE